MAVKWEISPSDGVTGSGGSWTLPKNTGQTDVTYTINYEDENGCKSSTSYTVPKCPQGCKISLTCDTSHGDNVTWSVEGNEYTGSQREVTVTGTSGTVSMSTTSGFVCEPSSGSWSKCDDIISTKCIEVFNISVSLYGYGAFANNGSITVDTTLVGSSDKPLPFGASVDVYIGCRLCGRQSGGCSQWEYEGFTLDFQAGSSSASEDITLSASHGLFSPLTESDFNFEVSVDATIMGQHTYDEAGGDERYNVSGSGW